MAAASGIPRKALQLVKRHGLIVVPLLALGTFLRVWNLHPVFLYGDEAEYAIVARYLAQDWAYLAYPAIEDIGVRPFVSQPPLVLYLMAMSMRLFGMTDVVAVSVSLVLGSLTVLVFYAIGVNAHGRILGALSALFIAVLPTHVSMSRKAFLDVGLVFFMALAILFALLWIQTRSKRWAIATGVAAGAATLSKLPGILILGVLLVYVLYELGLHLFRWLRTKAPEPREETVQVLRHVGWASIPLVAMGLAYLALILHLEALIDLYVKLMWQLGRVDDSLQTAQEVTEMYRPWHWYFTDPVYGLPMQMGKLLWWSCLAGAALALVDVIRRPVENRSRILLLLWPAVVLAFFVWSDRKESFYMLPVASALTILAALPFARAAEALRAWAQARDVPWRRAAGSVAVMVALLVASMPALAHTQQVELAKDETETKFGYGTKEAALWIKENDPEAKQIGGLLGRWTLHFYNEQPTYHWYVPHNQIENEIQSGEVRYLVLDTYLDVPHEESYFRYLVDEYDGRVIKSWTKDPGWGNTQLVQFQAAGGGGNASTTATEG